MNRILSVMVVLCALAPVSLVQGQSKSPSYSLDAVPSLGGTVTLPSAITQKGLLGSSTDKQSVEHPTLWDGKEIKQLRPEAGAVVLANDRARVLRMGDAFLLEKSAGSEVRLEPPVKGQSIALHGINSDGVVLGAVRAASNGDWQPVRWIDGKPELIGSTLKNVELIAQNRKGDVAGNMWKDGKQHAVIRSKSGSWVQVEPPPKKRKERIIYSKVAGLLDDGTVIGTIWLERTGQRVFRWQAEKELEILGDRPCEVLAVNAAGHFAGEWSVGNQRQAFIYNGTSWIALNDLKPKDVTWAASKVVALSDKDEAAVVATISAKETRGYWARPAGESGDSKNNKEVGTKGR